MPKTVTWKRFVAGFGILIPLVGLLAALQTGDIGNYVVTSASMEPTLNIGDRVFTTRIRSDKCYKGDIIALNNPMEKEELIAKRIIALPGDEILIRDGRLLVNGLPVDEPYLSAGNRDTPGNDYHLVPSGHVYVLGDNRKNSFDSREFGPVPIDLIKSKLVRVYLPVGRMRSL